MRMHAECGESRDSGGFAFHLHPPLLSEGTICGLLAVLRNRQQLFVLSQLQEYQEPVCHWGRGSFWCAPGVFVETLLRGA